MPMLRFSVAAACLLASACSSGNDRERPVAAIVAELDCVNGYSDVGVVPPAGRTVILGAVALPTERALSIVRSGLAAEARLWTKDGLIVSTDSAVELRVADEWRGKFAFEWGQRRDGPVEQLRVPACAASRGVGNWLAFTGGYYVADPACVAMIVTVGGVEERVEIGLGAPCAGQDPPVNPSGS
jgi:hypothetical protein